MTDGGSLFDPDTREAIRSETAPTLYKAFFVVSVVAAGVIAAGHHEFPFLAYATGACSADAFAYECDRAAYDAAAGLLGLLAFGGASLAAIRYRRIPPTITCESCGGRGWVLDLEPRNGRCPRCAGSLFTYRTNLGSANGLGPTLTRLTEHHRDGGELIERFHRTRSALTDRYF